MMSCFTPCKVGWAHGEGSSQWRFRSNPIREHLGSTQSKSQYKWDKPSFSFIKIQLGIGTVLCHYLAFICLFVCFLPETFLSFSHILIHLMLSMTLWGHYNYNSHFIQEETESQKCSKIFLWTTDSCSFPIQGSRKKCSGKDHWCFFIPLTPIANPLSLLSKYIRNPTPFNHLRWYHLELGPRSGAL